VGHSRICDHSPIMLYVVENRNKVNKLFLAPVSAQLNTNLASDSVQRLAFRLSSPLSL